MATPTNRADRWLTLVLIALTAVNLGLSVDTALTRNTYRTLIRQEAETTRANARKLDLLLDRFSVADAAR